MRRRARDVDVMTPSRDRIRGCILGGVIGDAFGAPLEGSSTSGMTALVERRSAKRTSWGYTDDSAMLLACCDALISVGTIEATSVLQALANRYEPARGFGHGMKIALTAFSSGTPWEACAFAAWPDGSRGNGGAVRIPPVAVARWDDTQSFDRAGVALMKTIAILVLLLPALSGYAQDQTYQNPIDKKAYAAPGGWQTYSPEGGVHPSANNVSLDNVRLLQAQQEIASRTTVEELSSFIKLAELSASEVFSRYEKPTTLLVQFTCSPGRNVIEIASEGEPPQDLLQAYYDKLRNLKPLRVSDEVKFQLTIKVTGN